VNRLLLVVLCSSAIVATAAPDAGKLPWYIQETAMTSSGRLTFLDKPWWRRAKTLAEGKSFSLDLNKDGTPDTLIERLDGNIIEIIDDSGRASDIANNKADAAYVVSLKGTGLVDRMIVYVDNDNDGKADEMEIRHYRDGYLRYAWIGENHDKDGQQIFALKNWSYAGGSDFSSKFRGNVDFYLNKYDPEHQRWVPLSECPFIFWDRNHDGRGDIVLRVSAAPLSSNTGKDSDYANNYNYMWAEKATPLSETGNMNVRFSYNIDPEPRREPLDQPHYTFGFNLVGAQPYSYPKMNYTNPRRRPPQTVVRIPSSGGIDVAMHYPAQQSGFTWDEARTVFRWEGQFWIYEREYMPNTGGPTMRWNMRREYSAKPSSERKLYYSDIDKRYHLLGASEGWLEVGHLVNQQKDLEFRYFDSDGDGYLDTTKVFEGTNPAPVRTSHVTDVRARPVTLARETMQADYNTRVLPLAIKQNLQLIAALKKAVSVPLAAAYEAEAAKATSGERQRYCLDIARELYFIKARDEFYSRNAAEPYPQLQPAKGGTRILTAGPVAGGYTLGDTLYYWKTAKQIEKFIESYGSGRLEETTEAASELQKMLPQR
jgi:hypothetical protein